MNKVKEAASFYMALQRFVFQSRLTFLTQEEIDARFDVCRECESFTGRKCKICGCGARRRGGLLNKLAYPLEHCPDDPPKW